MSSWKPKNGAPIDKNIIRAMDSNSVIEILIDEINIIKKEILLEKQLRENNPALQDAYNQYQTIKKLSHV